jgi:hypothetical protein
VFDVYRAAQQKLPLFREGCHREKYASSGKIDEIFSTFLFLPIPREA